MTFRIHTHGRLQEWVADARGYFADEGLDDYRFDQVDLGVSTADRPTGAYQTYEAGREASISCACHWTVNMAASNAHGRLWREAYSVSPCGVYAAPGSGLTRLADLAGVAVEVGYQSGSHYATIQALEAAGLAGDALRLAFAGAPDTRLARLADGESRAATLFGIQAAVAEQLGFRKLADATFMIVGLVPDGVDPGDVRRFYRALRRAQHDIDVDHQRFAHFYLRELPRRWHGLVDVAAFGPGERLVFEPYSEAMYARTHAWVEERGIFADEKVGRRAYADASV